MNGLLAETKIERETDALSPAKTTRMLLRLIRALPQISRVEIARRLGVNSEFILV
jgi:hypothetical protein